MLLWVQYQFNTNGGVLAVGAVWACFCDNATGGAVAVIAGGVCCFGCSTILILMVALWRSIHCGYVV